MFAVRIAASLAWSFATEVSSVFGRPMSFSQPACQTSALAAWVSTTMSAIIAWTSWKPAIGLPNCARSLEYATDASTQPWQIPTQPAATLKRPESSADMVVDTHAARGLVWQAAWLKASGRPNPLETSVAKLYATEASVRTANTAIQVHGGSGYVDDYPVERYLRDARVTTLYEGTSEIQRLIIGRAMTGINAMAR